MILYALRRLIYLVPVAFGVSLLVFALVHLAPGDAISAIVPPGRSALARSSPARAPRCAAASMPRASPETTA